MHEFEVEVEINRHSSFISAKSREWVPCRNSDAISSEFYPFFPEECLWLRSPSIPATMEGVEMDLCKVGNCAKM